MKKGKYDIVYDKSVKSWDEALPLGNGKLGCLIYGDGLMRFSLDSVNLWDLRPNPTTQEKGFTFQNLYRLVKEETKEAWQEYTRLFDDIFTETAYPCKITAGRLELDFGIRTESVWSKVDLQTAVAEIKIPENTVKIESFTSATRFVGVAKVWGRYALNIHIPEYISGEGDDKTHLHYPKSKTQKEGEYIYYEQQTHTAFRYGIVVLKKDFGEYSELYFTIATNNESEDFIAPAKQELQTAYKAGYEQLKSEHIAWWKKYWSKSEISIPDELLGKTYYRSWYLFASCSRKGFYPMPLQGVWTADNDRLPPWKGDYHHDTNTELSYQAYLKANRLDEGEVFVDYLWSLKSTFEQFAKEFYGVDGLLIPSCSTLDGKAMGGWAQYSLSPTMTIWAAQSFDEYYLYTGDEKFLKERAYPFLKAVGEAIYGLLQEKDGKLYLPLSSSPEIYDNLPKAYLTPNSNFDLALLRYLYKTLTVYEKRLGVAEVSKDILEKLDGIAVQDGKFVTLDSTQKLEETHRHFSHLMCLYPLHLINYDRAENKRIYEGSLFEIERLGTGMWVGFSFAMSAQIYAMAEQGNSAYEKLYQFANGFVAENGFHLNGDFKNYGYTTFHYRPFTLESSFGFCDALQEMLLQEHQGYLHVFPAIPDKWKQGKVSFNNLRSYGGVLISAKWNNGLKEIILKAPKASRLRVKNVFDCESLLMQTGKEEKLIHAQDGFFVIPLEKGVIKLTVSNN